MFNLGGLTGITSISQIPFIAVGGFGLFLYLLYAGKVNKQIGEKKEGAIGMFIVFAFIMDIFYLHDVWLVTILGTIAGVYATLAFAGVFGAVKKMGKLGFKVAEKVKKKREEIKTKKKKEKESAISDFQREVQAEREESVLLLNPEFITTVNKIRTQNSYFFDALPNVPALTHILTYLRQIISVLKIKVRESAKVSKLELAELKAEEEEVKEEAGEEVIEKGEVPAEQASIKELINEARLLPVQMRSQVQTAVSELQQAEAKAAGETGKDAQKIADEKAEEQLANMQIKIAKELNPLQKVMMTFAARMEKNLAKVEIAKVKGGTAANTAVTAYPPAKFALDFNRLYQQHEQVKALIKQAIDEEIRATSIKISEEMIALREVEGEVNEEMLLERSVQIKGQIDKVLGGKKLGKDRATLNESLMDLGLTKTEGALDNAYLQRLRAYLNFLNQMQAAMAASK
jgi:hypothetical protein